MATVLAQTNNSAVIHEINETLRGPVADLLARLVPELSGVPRREIYARALDDLELLRRCFAIFRRDRKPFRTILIDRRRRPVEDDTSPLSCGRTLAEVIAMVLRTAAKRYFRRALSNPTRAHAPSPARPSGPPLRRPIGPDLAASAAEDLYEAIKEYLLHDWQVSLVPAYAEMSPCLVRSLGPRLLEYREVAALRRVIDDPDTVLSAVATDATGTPAALATPVAPSAADALAADAPPSDLISILLTRDRQWLRPEAFTVVMLRPEVRTELAQFGAALHLTDVLQGVGGVPARLLLTGLHLSPDQLAVLLGNAYGAMGAKVFGRIFGNPGQPQLILRVVRLGLAEGIGATTSLSACSTFARSLAGRALDGGTEP